MSRTSAAAAAIALWAVAACGTTVSPSAGGSVTGVPDTVQAGGAGLQAPPAGTTTAAVAGTGPGGSAAGAAGGAASGITAGGPRPVGPVAPGGTSTSVVPAGTSPDRSPLKIGVAYTDTSGASGALGATSTSITGKSAAEAMVRGLNAAGGLAGRKVTAVEYSFNTQDTSYSQDAAAACALFTQDNHVPVVLDIAFGNTGGFGACLQKAGVVQVTTVNEDDRARSQREPLHANTLLMTPDRSYTAALDGLSATGYLGHRSRLGVILEQCPTDEAAYRNSIRPELAHLGLGAPVERTISCTTGFDSAGAASSPISAAVLAFRQAGVDRVVFVSDYEYVVLLLFANAAGAQGYQPGYVLTSNAQAEYIRGNIQDKRQWPQLHGVGWLSPTDVADPGPPIASEQRCLGLGRAGGVSASSTLDKAILYATCGTFLLLDEALRATSGHSEPRLLQAGIDGTGSGFSAPGLVAGGTTFTSTRHDGPDTVRVFGFDAGCQCLRYTGPTRKVQG